MGKITHMLNGEKGTLVLTLEDKYGTQSVVRGLISETDKKFAVMCQSNDGKTSFLLSDFLANKVEINTAGSLIKG